MTAPSEQQREYGGLFTALVKGYSNTLTFRRMAKLGEDAAQQRMAEHHGRRFIVDEDVVDLLMAFVEEKVFPDRQKLEEFFGGSSGQDYSPLKASASRVAIDSASIVFMHSAFDGVLEALCEISKALRPAEWLAAAGKRRVKRLGHTSIKDRISWLTSICGPVQAFEPIVGFVPDDSRLERIDGLRQVIVHKGDADIRGFASIDDDIRFLAEAGFYYCGLVSRTHGLRINN